MKKRYLLFLALFAAVPIMLGAAVLGISQHPRGISSPYWYGYSSGAPASYYLAAPTLSANDTAVGLAATQTLTNKTLTSPTINGGTIASATLTGPTITSPTLSGGCDQLLSTTTISLGADGNTTIYTVPAGKTVILTKAYLVAAADAGTSTLTIGQAGALTDFLGTQTLSAIDAAGDVGFLSPIPNATTPKIESYAAGTVIKAVVGSHAGSAGNTLYLFGFVH